MNVRIVRDTYNNQATLGKMYVMAIGNCHG